MPLIAPKVFPSIAALAIGATVTWPIAQTLTPISATALSAGIMTVEESTEIAFARPAPTLNTDELKRFAEGREMMHQRWSVFPSNLGIWGRGPLSNGEVCTDCHHNNGRGAPPEDAEQPMRSMLVQLSLPGQSSTGGPLPHLIYGAQLQHQGILGVVLPEGDAHIEWRSRHVTLSDGDVVELREPRVQLRNLAYGPIDEAVLRSARIAPPMVGVGLLEAIPETRLRELADRAAATGGRLNLVWSLESKQHTVGRFGWKANHPTLKQQIATAFQQDLGVTTGLLMDENCTPAQRKCLNQPGVQRPEVSDRQFDALMFYVRALAVPARRDVERAEVIAGQALFEQLNCGGCHAPEHRTGENTSVPVLAGQTIRPYTDILLHDMGDQLADGRPDFAAGPRDWRTAPLWGLGLNRMVNGNGQLLHDGRARTVEEAILWHGGEGKAARDAYTHLTRQQREALSAFVNSL